jgi:Zn finger protein HypA/HybF involved in hydrogenase expression
MNPKLISVLVLGAAAIAVTAWGTYPRKPRTAEKADYKYMHCPECERESPYSDAPINEKCPRCDKRMVPTEESIKTTGRSSPYTRMFLAVYAEVLALMAAVWFVTRPRPEGEIEYLYIRCEKCRRKLRYRETQVGRPGACPRCKRAFVFPRASGEVFEDDD